MVPIASSWLSSDPFLPTLYPTRFSPYSLVLSLQVPCILSVPHSRCEPFSCRTLHHMPLSLSSQLPYLPSPPTTNALLPLPLYPRIYPWIPLCFPPISPECLYRFQPTVVYLASHLTRYISFFLSNVCKHEFPCSAVADALRNRVSRKVVQDSHLVLRRHAALRIV
jgi:hypothetical protein